jgi:hypothetical protein
MRRLELLVNEVRESTDTTDINSLGVYEIMRYFNDGQRVIQKIIFAANPSADIFVKQAQYSVSGSSQVAFDLPFNIYAHSSISSVNSVKDSRIAQTLTRVAYREKETLWGYAILDDQIVLTTSPEASTISDLLVNYVYKLPVISYRLGQIDSIDTGTGVITVAGETIIDNTDFTERYDNYSIVSSKGVQKANQLYLSSFSGLTFTMEGTLGANADLQLAGAEIGDWVVCGEDGGSHSLLPDSCEPFLMSYVQTRILNKISSAEVATEALFSSQQRADIEDLFADTVKDALYPVSADSYFLGY